MKTNPRSILDRKCFPTLCATRLLPLLLLLLGLPAGLQAQFSYTTNNGAITITGYTGPGGVVTIPDAINGLPVTSIGDYAFIGCTSLTNVSIGNGVTHIGEWAFGNCTALTSVSIPNSVTSVADGAFSYCTGLTNVVIGNSVKSIEGGIHGGAFQACTSLTSVTIPDSVTSIGGGAFSRCTALTSVSIPNTVTSVGYGAFSYCTGLTNVVIGNSVTNLGGDGGQVFDGCTSLTSITIPNSVTSVGGDNGAFVGCTSLTNVVIGNSVAHLKGFRNCVRLASIVIPASVKTIGWGTFSMCINLSEVYFRGNAPILEDNNMFLSINATVYYLPGTIGWGPTYGGLPTVLWNPQVQTSATSFGVRTNRFGFNITGTTNLVIVVEACTDLAHPAWSPVGTNTLTGGSSYFSDAEWTNHPARFYRLRSP